MASLQDIWIEGKFEVVFLNEANPIYEARVRMAGSDSIRVGRGPSPREALRAALED